MIKTKNKNIYTPLVVTGYILFSLLVIATLLSTTIPFGILLFNPKVLHFNVAVILVALTLGVLLPVLFGYIIGDHAVKTKSKLTHHFNGVLFGLLAYWIMILLSLFINIPSGLFGSNDTIRIALVNVVPIIGVALVTIILSISHVRSRYSKQNILEYKPFMTVLALCIVILTLGSLIQNVVTHSVGIFSFVPLITVAVLGVISYATLRRSTLHKSSKLAWAMISISVLFVAMFVLPQLVSAISVYVLPRSTMEEQAFMGWAGFVFAFACWLAYWTKQVTLLSQSKNDKK